MKKAKLYFCLNVILYRVSLELLYVLFVVDNYASLGFFLTPNLENYFYSWISLFTFLAFSPNSYQRVREFFFLAALILIIVPLSSLYALGGRDHLPFFSSSISILGIYLILKLRLGPNVRLNLIKYGLPTSLFLSAAAVIYFIAWSLISGAIYNFNLDPMRVYDYRGTNAALMNVGLLTYINSWAFKVFNPFLISFSLLKKRYFLLAFLSIIQIFMYGITAQKSVLLPPMAIVATWLMYNKFTKIYYYPLLLSFFIIFSYFIYFAFSQPILAYIFGWRVFFVPADLTFLYFQFFIENEFVYWSNSFLASLIDYPYDVDVSRLIGDFQGTGWSANNGFISTGFSNAGALGVLSYSVLLIIILKAIEQFCYQGRDAWFTISIILPHIISVLTSVDLLTTLLTHGFFWAIIIVILVSKNNSAHVFRPSA